MVQFLIQTINGHLIKSCRIADFDGERERTKEEKDTEIATRQKQADDFGRKQIVITDDVFYEKIVSTYNKYKKEANFDLDIDKKEVICDKEIKIYTKEK